MTSDANDWPVEVIDALAGYLGDAPGTTIPLHALHTRRCKLWLAGEPALPAALIVVVDYIPTEPYVYGSDAAKAAGLLDALPDHKCINVSLEFADSMATAMRRASGRDVTRYGDLYFAQTTPFRAPAHPLVKLLKPQDAPVLTAATEDASPGDAAFIELLLREGLCAAAVVDGRVIAQTHAYCITPRFAEIGARTAREHRNRGLSTGCAATLAAAIHESGRTPVWSTGEGNHASQRVAEKLGFTEVARRVYLSIR